MPSYDEVLERLRAHLEPLTGPDVDLDRDTDLTSTLGLDSHKVMDILLDIEDEFEVAVPMSEVADVRTVGELASVVHRLVEER